MIWAPGGNETERDFRTGEGHALAKWNDRDFPNVEINLAKLPKWEWACPSQACSKISDGWILEKKSKEKVKGHGKYFWLLSPCLGWGKMGRQEGTELSGRLGSSQELIGAWPAALSLSHLYQKDHHPQDLSQEKCFVTTTLLFLVSFQEIKFEVAQPC